MKVKTKILSHTELNISFAELGALLGARAMLKHEVLVHSTRARPVDDVHAFNMEIACNVENCGSVACIGGTMAMIMCMEELDAKWYVSKKSSGALRRLFYPTDEPGVCVSYCHITAKQSIKAIDNFLTTGEPKWKQVLA